MKRSNLQAGCLLTREERWQLRLLADALKRRIDTASSQADVERLERQLGSVRREQLADRATRPRSGKKGKGRR